MGLLSIPRAYSSLVLRNRKVSLLCRRIGGPLPLSESQACRRTFVQIFRPGKAMPFIVTPIFANTEQQSSPRWPVLHVEKTPLSRSFRYRLDEELMEKTVRAEDEPRDKDEGKPEKRNPENLRLWMNTAANMRTTLQIFFSTMLWIMLFFMASIWENANCEWKGPHERGPRR